MPQLLSRPNITRTALPALAAFAITLAGTTVSAHALEGKALFEKLFKEGTQITYDSVSESGSDSFSALGVTIKYKDSKQNATIKALDVKGLKKTDNGRISIGSVGVTELTGGGRRGEPFTISGMVIQNSEVPYEIWKGGLSEDDKKQRFNIGTFSLTGFGVQPRGTDKFNIETITLQNADIPLDWRFDPKSSEKASPAAAPMTFDVFAMSGLSGSTAQGINWDVASMTINSANIPTSITATVDEWMTIYKAINVGKVTGALGNMQVFSMDSMTGTIGEADSTGTIPSYSEVNGINVNLKAIPDPQTQAIAGQLGYDSVQADMKGNGSYNPQNGTLDFTNLSLNFKDMADLMINYKMTGYTKDVANALQQAQVKIGGGANPQSTYGEMLPLLSKLKLENFKLALTDKSLTGRLLDFQAGQMGTTGDQLAQGAPMMIGLGMGGLNMPEFTEMVTKAVGSFLQNKGTLSVEAVPAEPVSIVNVVLAGQADPTKVPELLNLQVTAK